MGFESPDKNLPETPELRAEQYKQEALEIAQRMSQKWEEFRKKRKANPHIGNAKLEEIDDMTRPPVSGIQAWFEYQVKSIDEMSGNDEDARSRMMYRLKEDLEYIEEHLDSAL